MRLMLREYLITERSLSCGLICSNVIYEHDGPRHTGRLKRQSRR